MKFFLNLILFTFVIGNVFSQYEPIGLTVEHLFYAYFYNTNKTPTDREIDGFIADVYPREFQNSRSNEFNWRQLRQNAINQINEGIAKFNNDTLFYVQTGSEFSSYDFDHEGFPVRFANTLVMNSSNGNYTLVLTNSNSYSILKLDSDSAQDLLKRSTNLGIVDRSLILLVCFKFADFTQKEFSDLIRNRNGYFFHGLIENIEVHKSINMWDGTSFYVGELSGR